MNFGGVRGLGAQVSSPDAEGVVVAFWLGNSGSSKWEGWAWIRPWVVDRAPTNADLASGWRVLGRFITIGGWFITVGGREQVGRQSESHVLANNGGEK